MLLLLLVQPVAAQQEAVHWYFGDRAALRFDSTTNQPFALSTSVMVAPEGCSSRSDAQGNLLLYTNGETVWNRLHQPMANGTGLGGPDGISATQALLVPQPGSSTRFYVFTPPSDGSSSTPLYYSVVDLSRQGGLGEVIQKNVQLLANSSERVTAVVHANHRDVWIIIQGGNTSLCYAFLLTAAGLQTTPVTSPDGFVHNPISGDAIGQLKASPNGRRLAAAVLSTFTFSGGLVELFDFNARTGQLTNPVVLATTPGLRNCYGVEFSPDGTKLYTTNINTAALYQFDLTAPDIRASAINIHTLSPAPGEPVSLKGSLQLGPDGRLYVAQGRVPFLGIVTQPNQRGIACAYQDRGLPLAGRPCQLGLPGFLPHELWRLPAQLPICANTSRSFALPADYGADSVRWDFGDPATGAGNVSRLLTPVHTYAQPGVYAVRLTLYFPEGGRQVLHTQQQVLPRPVVDLGPDTGLCPGTVLRLAVAETAGNRYRWQDGSTASAYTVRTPGVYWVSVVSANGCPQSDTIRIHGRPAPQVRLGADTVVCVGEVLLLRPRSSSTVLRWRWQDNSTEPTLQVRTTGTYWVEGITVEGCSQRDSIRITYLTPPALHLGADTAVCVGAGPPFELDVTLPGVRYRWQDGSTGPTFRPTRTGTYSVTVSTPVCSVTDSIRVRLYDCHQAGVFVPNIITPNGDGRNDQLTIIGLGTEPWALTIFNRWGRCVYATPHYRQDWTAPDLPDGTYYYLLQRPAAPQVKGWLEVRR